MKEYICPICGFPHGKDIPQKVKECDVCLGNPDTDLDNDYEDYDHDALDLHTLR